MRRVGFGLVNEARMADRVSAYIELQKVAIRRLKSASLPSFGISS